MVWPLLRPLLAVTSIVMIGFSMIPEMFSIKSSSVHVFGITYDFQYNGHRAYLSTSFSEAATYLCPATDLPEFTPICPSLTQLRVAGHIYFGMSCLVLLIQLGDLGQIVLKKTRIFSATSKIDVYALSPIVFFLNLVIYSLVAGIYSNIQDFRLGLGGTFAILGFILLIAFAIIAMILERIQDSKEKAAADAERKEPLIPQLYTAAEEKEP